MNLGPILRSREEVAQLVVELGEGLGGTRKGVGILGRGKRGPGAGTCSERGRESRGGEQRGQWRGLPVARCVAGRPQGSGLPCCHGDPGPLFL